MNAGYSSGWCEESFGVTAVASEIMCRARGDDAGAVDGEREDQPLVVVRVLADQVHAPGGAEPACSCPGPDRGRDAAGGARLDRAGYDPATSNVPFIWLACGSHTKL